MRFSGVFVVSSLILSALALPAADFTPQINALSTKLKTAATQVQSFDGTVSGFDVVHNGVIELAQSVATTNQDLQSYPQFTAAESSANLVASEALVSIMEVLCDALIDKKPAFSKFRNGIPIIRRDINSVAAPSFLFVQGLINHTPNSDVPKALALQKRAMAKFQRLQTVYTN